ncbi:MAG: Rieske 2Fe-2S domain-containing protein [Planctomycetales bacterium]|nr:Rieske 2Fe-2S domain-containing protein [Planctomycetales bacterium]
MPDFVKVASVAEIPDPGKLAVECDERIVVVCHVDGQFYCIDDVCTHDGGPLGDGQLESCQIICPRHGARFDVRTGKALSMPATHDTRAHEIRIEGDDILVRLSG